MQFLWVLITVSILGTAASHEIEKRGATKSRDAGERRIVCYYTNWSVYRKGLAKYTPQNINPYMCTHLVYAFGGLTDEFEVTTFDSYQDIEQGGYAQFNGLKQYNKAMKTLLAIGGWNEGSARFSELVSAPEYRENFTLSVIKHLRRYNFDGLDLDWEYPGSRDGSAPEDKRNYAVLVKELREAFELEASKSSKKRLLLTMAVPAGQNYIDKGYEVPTLNKYLDFFNLLTYDYHSVYEPTVNHHAALLPAPGTSEYEVNYQLNIDWTIRYYLKKGASKDKLVMGIPTYGRSYTLLDGDYFTLGSSADGPGNKGNYTNEKGYLSFYEVCEAVSADGWEVRKPYPKRVGPFAFKGNQWVGYDDENFVIRKAEYVRDNGLGGVMFWTVDSDDFRGLCNGERYPLIEAAKKALLTPLPTDQNEARALDSSSSLNSLRSSKRTTTPATTTKPSRRRRPPGNRRGPNAQSSATIDPLNTPEPPTTPSSVKGFDCKREGFYPNPDDCKKYYWCLSSGTSGLGIVAHAFTCPSDLIFNKQIDGCDHPDRVKCKVTPSRGKAKEAGPPTTPIPTTTEFEYLLEDYDYYYYDFIGGDQEPLVEPLQEITLQKEDGASSAPSTPSRNSGGNQFQVSKKTPTQEEEEVRSPSSRATAAPPPPRSSNRARPQYASIQRDRSRRPTPSPRQEQGEPPVAQNERQPSRPSRPQYVTLERERPAAVDRVNAREGTNAIPAEPQGTSSTTPSGLGLSYVTLSRRRRPTTPIPEVVQQESTPSGGLEYVTLRRSRPLVTTEAPADYYEYYSYDDLADVLGQEEQTTTSTTATTTTTTTTTPKPRIRIPPSLRSPRPSPRPRPRPRPRPSSRTRTRARPSLPETFRSSSQRTRGRPTAEVKEAEQPEEEAKPAEPSTTAPVVEPATPKPEPVEPQTAVESREGETVLAEAGEPKSSDVESLIEETLQLFQQSDQELTTESSLKHSPNGSSSTTEPPSSPSVKVVTEPAERSDSTVIPVEDLDERPLRTRKPPRTRIPPRTRTPPRSRDRVPLPSRRPSRPRLGLRPTPVSEDDSVTTTTSGVQSVSRKVEPKTSSPFSFNDIISVATTTKPKPEREFRSRFRPSPTKAPDLDPETDSAVVEEKSTPSSKPGFIFDFFETTTTTKAPTTTTTPKTTTTTPAPTTTSTPETTTISGSQLGSQRESASELRPRPVQSFRPKLFKPEPPTTTTTTSEPQQETTTQAPTIATPSPSRRSTTTTPPPTTPQPRRPVSRRPSRPRPVTTARSFVPPVEYEYVYDYDNGALGGSLGDLASLSNKAVIHPDGAIECTDTGYFPHPDSCKKFISCSKTVRGFLRGWVYTCPQELVFDPVGGMCNWTETVDCLA